MSENIDIYNQEQLSVKLQTIADNLAALQLQLDYERSKLVEALGADYGGTGIIFPSDAEITIDNASNNKKLTMSGGDNGGKIEVLGPAYGGGGDVNINGGVASGWGGDVSIIGGSPTDSGGGGSVYIYSGTGKSGDVSPYDGKIEIKTPNGGITVNPSGNVELTDNLTVAGAVKVGAGSAISGAALQVNGGSIILGNSAGNEKFYINYGEVGNIGQSPTTLRSVSSNLELWFIQLVGMYSQSNKHGVLLVAGGSTPVVYKIAGDANLVVGTPTGWQIGITVSGTNIQASEGSSWGANPTTARLTILRSVW